MSKAEIKLKKRIHELEEALRPFSKVVVPEIFLNNEFSASAPWPVGSNSGGEVWLYIGAYQEGYPGDLHTDHFLMAQFLLRTSHK